MEEEERSGFMLLSLEERLAGDSRGEYKSELIEQMFNVLTGVKKHIDSGLPPDEFNRYDKLREATETGIFILEKVWGRLHST